MTTSKNTIAAQHNSIETASFEHKTATPVDSRNTYLANNDEKVVQELYTSETVPSTGKAAKKPILSKAD